MKETSDTNSEDSKTISYDNIIDKEGGSEEHICALKNGGISSSNSTVEESEKTKGASGSSSVRQYNRSKNPRLRWTPDLHRCFIHAIEKLGGQERATPKLVLQMMNIKGLSISHVKSHLQMHRSKKIDDPNEVLSEQGLLGINRDYDHHIYNFSQLPMLQASKHSPNSNSRYATDSWSRNANPTYTSFMGGFGSSSFKQGLLHSMAARNNLESSSTSHTLGFDFYRTNSLSFSTETQPRVSRNQEPWRNHLKRSSMDQLINMHKEQQARGTNDEVITMQVQKRKAEISDSELDLNLSLKIVTPENRQPAEKHEEERIEANNKNTSSLTLSLFSNCTSRTEERDNGSDRKHARRMASTLDLTL